jgi:hypothetical protein
MVSVYGLLDHSCLIALVLAPIVCLHTRKHAGIPVHWGILEIRLGFGDCADCIVLGVVFVVGAEFGDIPDYVFGGLAASERTLGVGPIALGLAECL